jgi:hypothetical protein
MGEKGSTLTMGGEVSHGGATYGTCMGEGCGLSDPHIQARLVSNVFFLSNFSLKSNINFFGENIW